MLKRFTFKFKAILGYYKHFNVMSIRFKVIISHWKHFNNMSIRFDTIAGCMEW